MQWINIKDEKPEIGVTCLFSNGKYIDIGLRTEKDILYCVSASLLKSMPTHWMPLPPLPQFYMEHFFQKIIPTTNSLEIGR